MKRIHKRMYAVSLEGVGLISGTLAYSRREAISHLHGGYVDPKQWSQDKRSGYRTVMAQIKIIRRPRTPQESST
jgi:hypothetical protein